MLTLSTAGLAAINANPGLVPMAVLVEMDFASPATPFNLNTSSLDLLLGGVTYQGAAGLGTISSVDTTAAEIKQLQYELSGVDSSMVSLVLSTPIQGTPDRLKLAIFDPASYTVTDTILLWQGQLDTMVLEDGQGTAKVTVTAEHIGIDLNRPAPLYFSDADQQALHPGDLFFQYVSQQFDQQIVWPAAAYFKK